MSGGLWNAPLYRTRARGFGRAHPFDPLSYPRVLSMLCFVRRLPFIWGALNSVKKCGILLTRRIWMGLSIASSFVPISEDAGCRPMEGGSAELRSLDQTKLFSTQLARLEAFEAQLKAELPGS